MTFDQWGAVCLVPLAIWVLVSGLDDLVLDIAVFCRWVCCRVLKRVGIPSPSESELDSVPQKRIAVFVPLWGEYRVIHSMLEHNVAVNRYKNYDFFVGAYPNDTKTLAVLRDVVKHFRNVHLAVCPHDGPTSKADCLNWIFQRMLLFEEDYDKHFDIVVTHDAEDLIHPDAFRWINYFIQNYDMVQVPVLPLRTPFREFTHGVYCDEFSECQSKDLPARQILGGFIPSCGVGTGFSRAALEKIAAAYSNRLFEHRCLTEDYENGYRLNLLNLPQIFLPIQVRKGSVIATREFFPRAFKAAVRQRTRWIMGIALQSWERHGWGKTRSHLYWFWRDRKGLIGNLVTPLANTLFLAGFATWLWSFETGRPWAFARLSHTRILACLFFSTLSLQFSRMSVRAYYVSRIYGWPFALGVPLRTIWANWINCFATVSALVRFGLAKMRKEPLVWLKTEHAYPSRTALMEHKREIGDILIGSQYISESDFKAALSTKPPNIRIGEHLVNLGKISEEDLYEALSLQQNMPLGRPERDAVSLLVTRSLPAEFSRKWKVLPYKVASGHLFLVGPELPSDTMSQELRQFSSLEIRFHLVTPSDFDDLVREFLPHSEDVS